MKDTHVTNKTIGSFYQEGNEKEIIKLYENLSLENTSHKSVVHCDVENLWLLPSIMGMPFRDKCYEYY